MGPQCVTWHHFRLVTREQCMDCWEWCLWSYSKDGSGSESLAMSCSSLWGSLSSSLVSPPPLSPPSVHPCAIHMWAKLMHTIHIFFTHMHRCWDTSICGQLLPHWRVCVWSTGIICVCTLHQYWGMGPLEKAVSHPGSDPHHDVPSGLGVCCFLQLRSGFLPLVHLCELHPLYKFHMWHLNVHYLEHCILPLVFCAI